MKKFKLSKPFSSLKLVTDDDYFNKSLKERWSIALHDPFYLILLLILIIMFILIII